MAIDHSLTYKVYKFRNIGHFMRLRTIRSIVRRYRPINLYSDVGCSNGYLTSIVSELVESKTTHGYDHSVNLEDAKKDYPKYDFSFLDLNKYTPVELKYDLVTCFETLEHCGNIDNACKNLFDMLAPRGVLIISVPIEIGFVGLIKYFLKRYLYRYELPLNCGDASYVKSLFLGERISRYRPERTGYGSHFGFDYRDVDECIAGYSKNANVMIFSSWTTRFYIFEKVES